VADTLVDIYSAPRPCACDCHQWLTVEQRTEAVTAMMRFDDAMRGWGYTPLYEPAAPQLFMEAKMRGDDSYRAVAIRDEVCLYSRLVGFAVHELIHAMTGDPAKANWGMPWGVPYGVPEDLPEGDEEEYLRPYNFSEACAWAGIAPVAHALFGIDWALRSARDVGTYGFLGGNAVVDVPPGFRPVPHYDRQISPYVYYRKARKLEQQAREWLDDERLASWGERLAEAEKVGRTKRKQPFPRPDKLARLMPKRVGRNEPCVCGSGKKYKRCCAKAS
jgi:hypothetical protein